MSKFRVAISGDLLKDDGTPAIPAFDLSRLERERDVEFAYIGRGPVLDAAERYNGGCMVRVPHSSGLLEGNLTLDTKFPKWDHRSHRPPHACSSTPRSFRSWCMRGKL